MCELEVERGPDWLLVRVRKLALAKSDATALADRLWSLLEQHFTRRLLLELDNAGTLDSNLLAQLSELHRRIEKHNGVMRVCGLSPDNLRVLHACHLDERLPAYLNRHEAVMGGQSCGSLR
jgi:anti-anti-sigma regulatory factor